METCKLVVQSCNIINSFNKSEEQKVRSNANFYSVYRVIGDVF